MKKDIRIYEDNPAVARAFAEYLEAFTKSRTQSTIALSGGSTPKLLFDLLAREFADRIPWSTIHFFWGDERCVPPDHEDSNYGMTKSLLFDPLKIPEGNVHRVLGENDPTGEAIRYGEEISQVCEVKNNLPSFDLMILGMGDDGHTASIFPHQMELLTNTQVCAVANHPVSGQQRVTITGPVLNNSEKVTFLVTGQNKAEKIQSISHDLDDSSKYPANHITGHQQIWFLDQSAASLLK